jgi:hypothetical protein
MNLYQKAVTQIVNFFIRRYPLHSYRKATGFGIMNFTKHPSGVFANDLLKFMRELKENYNANKFEFLAYVGSEAEKMYKKFIARYGGNIVGIKKRSQKLADGKYYDSTIFEIMREDMKF